MADKFSAEERAAMKERNAELKAAKNREAQEKALLDKVAELPDDDRELAERLHALVTKEAPDLQPKTYYGMPAWANADGKNVLFFQPASKFKVRYATLGFEHAAKLDDGDIWPTSYALLAWNAGVEKKVRALLKQAIG